MDTNGLVKVRIDDGQKFINMLSAREFDVTAACWAKTSDEGDWYLYIASPKVEENRLADAYREAYGTLRMMEGTTVSASEVKLIGERNPITTDLVQMRRHFPDKYVDSSVLGRIGAIAIEGAYIYGFPFTLRQSYRVRYLRQGQPNTWRATTRRGRMLRDVTAKGAVAYTTARWEGQTAEDENFATVSVLLELDPRCDDRDLIVHPNIWLALADQANEMADAMFKRHHPEAVIEHGDQQGEDDF